jgi:hypothetical protein
MSKPVKHIRNLTELEKEIYRLKLQAIKAESKLSKNFDYFRDHYSELIINSVFHRSRNTESLKEKVAESLWTNPKLQHALNRLVDVLADKAVDAADHLFKTQKQSSRETEE